MASSLGKVRWRGEEERQRRAKAARMRGGEQARRQGEVAR